MKGKPNINAFLEGGDTKPQVPAQAPSTAPSEQPMATGRITKTIRMAADLEVAVKEKAHEEWRRTGRKVSESDVIEAALRKYLRK